MIKKLPPIQHLILLSLLAAAVPVLANVLINFILKFELGRAAIFRNAYIDGYWLAETRSQTEDDDLTLSVPAVFWVDHDQDGSICPDIRRMPSGESELWTYSNSIQAVIDERGRYVNRAYINDGGRPRELFAWGTFKRFGKQLTPSSYDGHVITAGRDQIWQQTAVKIPKRIVSIYRDADPFSWVENLLVDYVGEVEELESLRVRLGRLSRNSMK